MGAVSKPSAVAAACVLVLLLCGCGEGAGRSDPTPSRTPTCVAQSGSGENCEGYPLASQMADNRAYRKHAVLAPAATAAADPSVARVRRALQPLASMRHPTEQQLVAALGALHLRPGLLQTNAGLRYGIESAGGCIDGEVGPGTVTAVFEGYVADGGCLALQGH